MPIPVLFTAAYLVGQWLAQRSAEGRPAGGPRCVVCQSPAALTTDCCRAPLCEAHAAEWRRDPHPCPCRRR